MIGNKTIKQMHIVLAKSAEVEEFVNVCRLQSQLRKTCNESVSRKNDSNSARQIPEPDIRTSCLLNFICLPARRSESVGSEVFANIGRIGGIEVGISRYTEEKELVFFFFLHLVTGIISDSLISWFWHTLTRGRSYSADQGTEPLYLKKRMKGL